MNSKPFNTKRAVAVLITVTVISLYFLCKNYFETQPSHTESAYKGQYHSYINFWSFFYPALFILEIFIYRCLRHKNIIRLYANIHLWTLAITKAIIPLLFPLFVHVIFAFMSPGEIAAFMYPFINVLRIAMLALLITGHVFLILLIIKRNSYPVKENTGDDSRDHLHEFAE